MFIDETSIKARAGDGGRGCASFRREKYEPWGGPNGGDGGKGGDVILRGDDDQNNLIDFKFKPHWNGERGGHGLGSDCNGREGKPAILRVPLGTVAYNKDTGEVVAEILEDGQEFVLCKGGKGGFGNTRFKSSVTRAPRKTGPGEPGEIAEFKLELKSIADVGLVGFPNAGKSSLTNLITNARPKTAPYPFTTLHPQIGVIDYVEEYERIVMADVPGLIAGANEGKGLGHRFLRHLERCKLLLILIDMAGTDTRDPRDDYKQLLQELELYDEALLDKPRIVVANKMDEDAAVENIKKFKKRYSKVDIIPISCLSEVGIPKLRKELLKRVLKMRAKEKKSSAAKA
ncbi:GTPase ObgE [Oleiharenicola lentus]|uniref:GTPase ObgE n=1 Tax=Oleiharenicola lentus TaxID=2508720 RepID=UPI003F67B857